MPSVQNELREKERDSSSWYTGVDLQWRTPPPMSTSNGRVGGRKRAWEEIVTPPLEQASVERSGRMMDMQVRPHQATVVSGGFGVTEPPSYNGSLLTGETEDDVEEIPRTKMQTGCIPCL
jgi:hypothetical protein